MHERQTALTVDLSADQPLDAAFVPRSKAHYTFESRHVAVFRQPPELSVPQFSISLPAPDGSDPSSVKFVTIVTPIVTVPLESIPRHMQGVAIIGIYYLTGQMADLGGKVVPPDPKNRPKKQGKAVPYLFQIASHFEFGHSGRVWG